MSYIWENQTICSYNWLKSIVKEILQNQFVQDWRSIVDNSPKCINYRIFKTNLNLEKYLLILPTDLRITFTKLRTCNHRFPIETGRWHNIEKHLRKCTMCDSNSIGDEFHYILECTYFVNDRKMFLPKRYYENPNIIKFNEPMNTYNVEKLKKKCQDLSRKFLKSVLPKANSNNLLYCKLNHFFLSLLLLLYTYFEPK